jgi:hypothetical protein
VLRVVAPRVLAIAFAVGMFVARDQTTAIVIRMIDAEAAVMTGRLERALPPAFDASKAPAGPTPPATGH